MQHPRKKKKVELHHFHLGAGKVKPNTSGRSMRNGKGIPGHKMKRGKTGRIGRAKPPASYHRQQSGWQ